MGVQTQFTDSRINNGEFYEAHQSVRTLATRYIKGKKFDDAYSLLFESAKTMLEKGQVGSGSDLTLYLIEAFATGSKPADSVSRAQLTTLLRLFPPTEPSLKQIGQEVTKWVSANSEFSNGDPELNHVLGVIFAKAGEAYEAEKYLLLGTRDSPAVLAGLLFEWYTEDSDRATAALYASRGTLGYLSIQNVRDARQFTSVYLDKLAASGVEFTDAKHDAAPDTIRVSEQHPLLTFLQLLVLTCQHKNTDMFRRLKVRYDAQLRNVSALEAPLQRIGMLYFGIEPPRQGNLFQDLMGSFLGGGGM